MLANSIFNQICRNPFNPIFYKSSNLLLSGPALATGILRLASAANRYANYLLAVNPTYVLGNCSRYKHKVGSGALSEIRLAAYNNILWAVSVDSPGNTLTIVDTFIEIPGKGTQRVTWGGLNGATLANGAYDLVSDALLPSAFGLTEFALGLEFFVRTQVTIPNTGSAKLPIVTALDMTDGVGRYFNSETVQCKDIGGTGNLFYTGPVGYPPGSWTPIVLGKFVAGDPNTWIGAGDSILSGVGDDGDGAGTGFFSRALFLASLAGLNCSRPGGYAWAWQDAPALAALAKYANGVVEEYGTNHFDNTANIPSSSVQYAVGLSRNIWDTCKSSASQAPGSKPFKVIRTKLLPRTNTPTGTGVEDQVVYGPKWDAGGNTDEFNASIEVDPLVDVFLSLDAISRASTTPGSANYYKWKQGSITATDGTHPNKQTHIDVAALLRAQIE